MSLWFSHLRLSRAPSARALSGILMPEDSGARRSAQHNLLWSVFSDGPDRRRDFLWREDRDGSFLTLSAPPPVQSDLFEPHRVREYAPQLAVGDRLEFTLLANATRMKRGGARVDVVMDALHALPPGERAAQRMVLAGREGRAWLERQGEKAGFAVIGAEATDYRTETVPGPNARSRNQKRFGILDLTGQIEIGDPATFLAQLPQGFGRAKSFGCGLMLLRRAP